MDAKESQQVKSQASEQKEEAQIPCMDQQFHHHRAWKCRKEQLEGYMGQQKGGWKNDPQWMQMHQLHKQKRREMFKQLVQEEIQKSLPEIAAQVQQLIRGP